MIKGICHPALDVPTVAPQLAEHVGVWRTLSIGASAFLSLTVGQLSLCVEVLFNVVLQLVGSKRHGLDVLFVPGYRLSVSAFCFFIFFSLSIIS